VESSKHYGVGKISLSTSFGFDGWALAGVACLKIPICPRNPQVQEDLRALRGHPCNPSCAIAILIESGCRFLASITWYPDLNRRIPMILRTLTSIVLVLCALAAGAGALAQSNPNNSAMNPYLGSVQAVPLTPGVKQLSLDDAIKLGIEYNLALTLAHEQQKSADAEKLQLANILLPNLSLHAETGLHQVNLEAQGFHPAAFSEFASFIPKGAVVSLVPKVDTTNAQFNFSQALFNWAGYDVWRAAQAEQRAAYYNANRRAGWSCST
jgi:hypothetical protein